MPRTGSGSFQYMTRSRDTAKWIAGIWRYTSTAETCATNSLIQRGTFLSATAGAVASSRLDGIALG